MMLERAADLRGPMKSRRIHMTGASGSGVTSLGRALGAALALPHHDTDDYLWAPTTPPYRELRPAADRLRLMRERWQRMLLIPTRRHSQFKWD